MKLKTVISIGVIAGAGYLGYKYVEKNFSQAQHTVMVSPPVGEKPNDGFKWHTLRYTSLEKVVADMALDIEAELKASPERKSELETQAILLDYYKSELADHNTTLNLCLKDLKNKAFTAMINLGAPADYLSGRMDWLRRFQELDMNISMNLAYLITGKPQIDTGSFEAVAQAYNAAHSANPNIRQVMTLLTVNYLRDVENPEADKFQVRQGYITRGLALLQASNRLVDLRLSIDAIDQNAGKEHIEAKLREASGAMDNINDSLRRIGYDPNVKYLFGSISPP